MAGFFKQVRKAIRTAQKSSPKQTGKPRPTKLGRATVVRIDYREFHEPAPRIDPNDLNRGYAYTWNLPTPPSIGQRVILEHARGQAGIIVGFNTTYKGELLAVHRIATDTEIKASISKAAADEQSWLDMARRAAGLSSPTRRRTVPQGFPSIAPVDGRANGTKAGEYGSMWWRVYKTAQRDAWPEADIRVVESIARRWYAVRDKGGN